MQIKEVRIRVINTMTRSGIYTRRNSNAEEHAKAKTSTDRREKGQKNTYYKV